MRGVRRARVMYCKPGGQPGGVGVETLEGSPTWISLAGTDDNFLWNDGFWFLTDLFWGMETGESIRSHILGTWTIGDREIEAGENQRPPGLSGLSLLASRRYCRFCEDDEWMLRTLKSNQIKSNHFYCHITTAQVPW